MAAQELELPHGTVRDLYRGRTGSPSVTTLRRLAATYGVPLSWLLEPGSSDPPAVFVGYLTVEPPAGAAGDIPLVRRVRVPLAAWSLYRTASLLLEYLRSLPPAEGRPIVGDARDDRDLIARLTRFLLQPVLSAEAAGDGAAVRVLLPDPVAGSAGTGEYDRGIEALRALGHLWRAALPGLLARAREREREERRAEAR